MKIGIVAGETSGDLLGAGLINTLQHFQTISHLSGIGGTHMIAAGCQSLFDIDRLAVMGIIEPLLRLRELFRIRSTLCQHFINHRPDVFIGIDAPDFNVGLEVKLRQAGIPVIHYVSPSVWAWRQNRIKKIAKATDLVLTLFPFETDFYTRHQVPAVFVGHPLADQIPLQVDKKAARKKLQLDEDATYIAILPGSRNNEIKNLAEIFIATAAQIHQERPGIKFITALLNPQHKKNMQMLVERYAPKLPISYVEKNMDALSSVSHEVMAAADVVLVTSGTATLETMLFKRPMVIAYRMGHLTYQIARYLVKTPFIGLPNILANEKLVPEFIQHEVTVENIKSALLNYVDHPEKISVLENTFLSIHQQLKGDANRKAAQAVVELVNRSY